MGKMDDVQRHTLGVEKALQKNAVRRDLGGQKMEMGL